MTQPFYTAQTDVAVGSRGKASDINNLDSAVEQAFKNVNPFGIDSGTSSAYVVTMDTDATAYYDGMVVSFAPDNTNTVQSPTINVNGLGAKSTASPNQLSGVVEIGEIQGGGYVYTFIYSVTLNSFVIQGSSRLNSIPGEIGGTTPAAGAFTTLSASSTVSGAGFSTYLASPPAIGGTAAAAGKFTLLTATGSLNLTGIAANHFIKYGNAVVFNSTGLTGGTEYGGLYSTNSGALVLYGGSSLGSTIKITDYTIELRQSGLVDTAILRFAAGSVVGSFNAYNVGETGHSDMTWNANTHSFGVADGGGGTQTELEIGPNTINVTNDLVVGGVLTPLTDNVTDVGAASFRFKDGYFAGQVKGGAGTGTGQPVMIGTLSVNTTAVGNVGGGTDDLMTYSLPANSLSANGKGVRVTMWGTFANNANAKELYGFFGSGQIAFNIALPTSATGFWRIVSTTIRTGSNAQTTTSDFQSNTSGGSSAVNMCKTTSTTETDSGAITIKASAVGVSDNDVVQTGMLVEFIN